MAVSFVNSEHSGVRERKKRIVPKPRHHSPLVINGTTRLRAHTPNARDSVGSLNMSTKLEIDSQRKLNSAAVSARAGELLNRYGPGHVYVLARAEKIIAVFETKAQALEAGRSLYSDRMFSVHEVTDTPRRVGRTASAR